MDDKLDYSASSDEEEFVDTKQVGTTKRKGQASKKKRKRVGRACVFCQRSHMSCDEGRPCKRCIARGTADQCRDGKRKRRGRKRKSPLPEDEEDIHSHDHSDIEEDATTAPARAAEVHKPVGPTPIKPSFPRQAKHKLRSSNGSAMDEDESFEVEDFEDDEEHVEICEPTFSQRRAYVKRVKKVVEEVHSEEEVQSSEFEIEDENSFNSNLRKSSSSEDFSLDFSSEEIPSPNPHDSHHDPAITLFPGLLETSAANFEVASLQARFPNCWTNRSDLMLEIDEFGTVVPPAPHHFKTDRYSSYYNRDNYYSNHAALIANTYFEGHLTNPDFDASFF